MKTKLTSLILAIVTVITLIPAFAADAATGLIGIYSDELVAISEEVTAAMTDFKETYSLEGRGITSNELRDIMRIARYDNPHLVHMSSKYSYSYSEDTGERLVVDVIFEYTMPEADFKVATSQLEHWASRVIALAQPGMSQLDYAIYFHDYLVSNFETTEDDIAEPNLYTFVRSGKGVCQSYTFAFNYLMEKAGATVSFAQSYDMLHVWSLVNIGGNWYHADVAWDDPVGNLPGSVYRDHFLLSDAAISSMEDPHYNWQAKYSCTDTKYDSIWFRSLNSGIAQVGDKYYYIYDRDLYATADMSLAGASVVDHNMEWLLWGDNTSRYKNTFSAVMAFGGKVYYNTPTTVAAYDPLIGLSDTVKGLTPEMGTGYFYGFSIDHGSNGYSGLDGSTVSLKTVIATAPNVEDINGKTVTEAKIVREGFGDANGDEKINLMDVAAMLKTIAMWNVEINTTAADADLNGKITLIDVQFLMKVVAGWY